MDWRGPPVLPFGWKAEWDPRYGQWFYVNLFTEQSQWEIPLEYARFPFQPVEMPFRAQIPPPALPKGWEAEWDSRYEAWYYANIYTKKSQWEKPTEPASTQLHQESHAKGNKLQQEKKSEVPQGSRKASSQGENLTTSKSQVGKRPELAASSKMGLDRSIPSNAKQAQLDKLAPSPKISGKAVTHLDQSNASQSPLGRVMNYYSALLERHSAERDELSKQVNLGENPHEKLSDADSKLFLELLDRQQAELDEFAKWVERQPVGPQKPYQRLPDADSMRLLELHPGSRADPLSGALLQPTSLGRVGYYDALSYRWSDVNKNDPSLIEIDNVPFPIGPDLHAALIQFRQEEISRYLWIDQICINQSDTKEKIQQMKIMADIYSKAGKVLIWLGEASDQSDVAMEFFPIFVEQVQRNDVVARSQRSVESPSDIIESKGKLSVALNELFERPWFGRVWTLQEAALGQSAEVWCGSKSFPFHILETFERGCDNDRHGHWGNALSSIAPASRAADPENPPRNHITHVRMISMLKQGATASSSILNAMRSLDCSQDQDRVYSVLHFLEPDLVNEITSKDKLSIAGLYHRVAAHGIQRGEVDYLGASGLSQHRTSQSSRRNSSDKPCIPLPSWVPDWTYKVQTHSYWVHNRESITKKGMPLFVAGGKTSNKHDWSFSDAVRVLKAPGIIIATVKDCTNPYRALPVPEHLGDMRVKTRVAADAQDAIKSYVASCMKLAAQCVSRYGSANVERACRHSLVGGMMPDASTTPITGVNARATDEAVDSLFEDFETFCWILSESHSIAEAARRSQKDKISNRTDEANRRFANLQKVSESLGDISKKNNLMTAIAEACKGRRFFITGGKHYMGVVPEITEPGDKLCVLLGCCAPFVIRPKNNRYQLLGECFVPGLMDGEILDDEKYEVGAILLE